MSHLYKKFVPIILGTLFVCSFYITSFAQQSAGDGIQKSNIDKSVSPKVNFYDYAVGNWIKNTKIPPAYPSWNTFSELNDSNYAKLKKILVKAENDKSAKKGSIKQKIGDFFYTGMDTVKIEKESIKPIEAELKAIDNMKNTDDFYKQLTILHLGYSNPLFSFSSGADAKNSKMEIAQLSQAGLGLPDRDYYLKNDTRTKEVRKKYHQFIKEMFVLIGENSKKAEEDANTVLKIETKLAKASMSKVERRNPKKTYNKMALLKLVKTSPGFDWQEYFTFMGVENPGDINVREPKFFEQMAKMVYQIPVNEWKPYFKWNVIRSAAPYLSPKFEKVRFDFYGKVLYGIKKMQPRWKRVLGAINGHVGELLGQLYVKKYFPPEAKARAKAIVMNLINVFGSRIKNLSWMSEKTKKQADRKSVV